MSADSESRVAFNELFEFMKQLDTDYLSEERRITEAADVAEGEHMLLHLLKAGLDVYVDNDPGRPRFAPLAGPTLKWGGEGADNPSHCAPLDVDRRYVIGGSIGDAAYVSFTVYKGKQDGDWNDGVVSALNHREFTVDAEGRYEIEVSADPKPGALHMERGVSNCVIARHYFENDVCAMADPTLHIDLSIEALDAPTYPRPLSPPALVDRLKATMTFIHGQTMARPPMGAGEPPAWFSLVPNQLPQPLQWVPTEGGGAGAVDNAYCAGLYVLGPEEALVIDGRWPPCVYANVMLWNRFMQGYDYRYRSCSLNRTQMRADADGRFSAVVAHQDPGVPNWLDTEGRPNGILYWRFLLSEGEIEQPRCRVMPVADVASAVADG